VIHECPKTFKNFWSWIGAPNKDSIRMPMLPYQQVLLT
jgi:hypothetical protein